MKVLIIHNEYRQYGGEDTVVDQEHKAYKALGHEVMVHIEKNTELNPKDLIFSIFNPISLLKIRNVIKEFKPDIVHIHNIIFRLSPSIFWALPKDSKTFMTIHNYRALCPSGTLFYKESINTDSKTTLGLLKNITRGVYRSSVLKTLVLALVYRMNYFIGSFNKINYYIFLTPFAEELHRAWMPKRFKNSVVKPNFLMQKADIKLSKKKIDLIFVGRFTIEKGIMDILPVLLALKSLNIHLVGDGPQYLVVEKQVKNCKHITLHGNKNRKEVFDLLDLSKYLIFPSIWYEGMPVTILEAYAKGIPVIARSIGAMNSMVINNISGFLYNSKKELRIKLNNLDNYNYSNLSTGAYNEFVNKYSQEQGLKNISKLIHEGSS